MDPNLGAEAHFFDQGAEAHFLDHNPGANHRGGGNTMGVHVLDLEL